MEDFDRELQEAFLEEATQLLEDAEQTFLDLESSPDNPETLDQIFRLAHNLKGSSRAVGFGEIAEFTHEVENVILKMKNGELKASSGLIDLLLKCNDHIKMMINGLTEDLAATFDSEELATELKKYLNGEISEEAPEDVAPEEPQETYEEEAVSEDSSFEPAMEAELEAIVDDSLPAVEESTPPVEAAIEEAQTVSNESTVTEEVVAKESVAEATPAQPVKEPEKIAPQPAKNDTPAKSASGSSESAGKSAQAEESLRVKLSKIQELNDYVGELVIASTVINQQIFEADRATLKKSITQLSKITKEIHEISMGLRMLPIKQTFSKMQRIVRDTSRALNKNVKLHIIGEETEVDKTIIEHVNDPLVHIVRNAVDHGLESTEDRVNAGKPDLGNVYLRAYHEGNNLVIEVQDDGGGINKEKLVEKAKQKGLIAKNVNLSEQETYQLLFHPGFSTKDQVSEISGRGVGLDVVRTNLKKLSGDIHITSKMGEGSCFKIYLPLTLAIIDGMVAKIGKDRYVIPVTQVQETLQLRNEDIDFVSGGGEVLNLRGDSVPLFRLAKFIKSKDSKLDQAIAVISKHGGKNFAVLVDDIIRKQQVVIKNLGPEIKAKKGFSGSAILGDGKPSLIIDLVDMFKDTKSAKTKGAA